MAEEQIKRRPGRPRKAEQSAAPAKQETTPKRKGGRKTPVRSNQEQREQDVARFLARATRPGKRAASTPPQNLIDIDDDDSNKLLGYSIDLYSLSPISIADPIQVNKRIIEYLNICAKYTLKPGVAGLSMALGCNRQRVYEIANGIAKNVPNEVVDLIKRVYMMLDSYWETMMQTGKINPASGIFIGKNNFGYKDVQDHVITPNTDNTSTPDELKQRLIGIPDE